MSVIECYEKCYGMLWPTTFRKTSQHFTIFHNTLPHSTRLQHSTTLYNTIRGLFWSVVDYCGVLSIVVECCRELWSGMRVMLWNIMLWSVVECCGML